MASDSKVLGDYISLASGNTPSKSKSEYWGGGVPWVSAKDMGDFWLEDSEDHLTEVGASLASRVVPAGTVLMLTRGMTLHNRVPICRISRAAAFNQDVKAVLPKDGISPRFLPYLMSGNHDRLHERVDSAGHGTGRLNTQEILSLPVHVPAIEQQLQIASIGESMDERIHTLRQTNVTLEAIAQALFKSWFVDFDPVRAKAEGREPEGMGAATAALFPSEFEDSELGPIPKGWRSVLFGDVARLSKGGVNPALQPDREFHHYSLPAFDSGLMPAVEPGSAIKSNKTPVPSGAVLVSKLNPHIPRIWFVGDVDEHAICSTEFLVWAPAAGFGNAFVYSVVASSGFNSTMRQLVTGTSNSHQRVKPSQLEEIPAGAISDPVLEKYEAIVVPMLQQALLNRHRTASLAGLRDTLLPRLISGKLQLPKAKPAEDA